MTYKQIVDKIEGAVNDHGALYDWGYGQLSDIKILDEDHDGANYPYAFLTPAGVTRNNQSTVYGFSLIIMEMANRPQDVLKIQSDCIEYLNDIISVLRMDSNFLGDVILNNNIQVFRERFQDDVAGATASFQIAIPDPINNCDAPVAEWFTVGQNPTIYTDLVVPTQYSTAATDGCSWSNMNVHQWKWTFDLELEALVDLTSWTWKYISVARFDSETLEYTIIDRLPLTIGDAIGSVETVQWTSEFEFECPLSDTDADTLVFYIGDWRDTAPLASAIQMNGTLRREYKNYNTL